MKAVVCLALMCELAVADGPRSTPPPAKPEEPNKIKPAPPPPPSPPDPIVEAVKNANLESKARHQGWSMTFALGGSLTVGLGIDDAVGRGPGASLRFGYMATERIGFTAEIASMTLLHQAAGTSQSGDIQRDQNTNLLLGLQFHANRTLWFRIAGGIGDYRPAMKRNLAGPAGTFGAGLDVVRFRRAAIGLEMMSIGLVNREGVLSTTAFMLAVNVE